MKTPWTPGPWTTCGASDHKCACGLVWDASGSIPVAAARDGRQDDILLPEEQHRANAALIAAAPDLAEALEQALAFLDHVERDGCAVNLCELYGLNLGAVLVAARAALRKAGAL